MNNKEINDAAQKINFLAVIIAVVAMFGLFLMFMLK